MQSMLICYSFIEPTKGTKQMKDQTQKIWPAEYNLVCTMKWMLRTHDELRAMGKFEDVPEYYAPVCVAPVSAAPAPKKSKAKSAAKSKDDGGSRKTSEAGEGEDEIDENDEAATSKAKPKAKAVKAKKAAPKKPAPKRKEDSEDEKEDESEAEEEESTIVVEQEDSLSPPPSDLDENISEEGEVSIEDDGSPAADAKKVGSIKKVIEIDDDLPVSTGDDMDDSGYILPDEDANELEKTEKQTPKRRPSSEGAAEIGKTKADDSQPQSPPSIKRSQSESDLPPPSTPSKSNKPNAILGLPHSPATLASIEQAALLGNDDIHMKDEAPDNDERSHAKAPNEKSFESALLALSKGKSVATDDDVEMGEASPVIKAEPGNAFTDLVRKDLEERTRRAITPISEASTEIAPEEDVRRAVGSRQRSNADSVPASLLSSNATKPRSVPNGSSQNEFASQELGDRQTLKAIKDRIHAKNATSNLENHFDQPIKEEQGNGVRDFQDASTSDAHAANSSSTMTGKGRKSVSFSPEAEEVTPLKVTKKTGQPDGNSSTSSKPQQKVTAPTKTLKSSEKSKSSSKAEPIRSATKVSNEKGTEKRKSSTETPSKPAKKRKTSAVTENKVSQTDMSSSTPVSPARSKAEEELRAANARVQAAEKRKVQLLAEYEAALAAKEELQEVRAITKLVLILLRLIGKTGQIESAAGRERERRVGGRRTFAFQALILMHRQAQIAALYG